MQLERKPVESLENTIIFFIDNSIYFLRHINPELELNENEQRTITLYNIYYILHTRQIHIQHLASD